jgi:hypothetical protein
VLQLVVFLVFVAWIVFASGGRASLHPHALRPRIGVAGQ